ncbi:hypothetical protein SESBI_02338 [Sesbania bispinosa]|nr:hypothetical protein SESBI_02338 [Sesbania bispinosa]
MATAAYHTILQRVFDGAISMNDMQVERRPYHKNCGCAFHSLKGICSNADHQQRYISLPKKTSQIECSMYTSALKFSSQSSFVKRQTMTNRQNAGMVLSHKPHSFV